MHVEWRRKFAKLAVGATVMLGCSQLVMSATGDWPQWRGPKRDNISNETGLLKDWPKEGPALLWETKGLGGSDSGYSSVSVADGKIFTMGSFPNAPKAEPDKKEEKKEESKDDKKGKKAKAPPIDETTAVIALDLSGKILWTTKIGPTSSMGNPEWTGARCTPTVDGDRVFAVGDGGDLVCLAADEGKLIWHVNLKKDLGGSVGGWAYTESPTIEGDKLICCPGGKQGTLAALDKKTGAVLWRSKDLTDSASYASLVPADINGAHQYVVLTPESVAGVGTDGSLLWKAERVGKTAVIPTPVVKDNLVFVTSGYGVGCNAFKIEGSSTALKAEKAFDNKTMAVHHGGVIAVGDYVYGTNEQLLVCMSLKDGSVAWKDRSVGKGSLAYADGRLYVRSQASGDVALVEATPDAYKEHGILKQPDRNLRKAWAHPVIAGGRLYLRDQGLLLCYDIKAK
jgi:outer membrane protein assembly factor BamB